MLSAVSVCLFTCLSVCLSVQMSDDYRGMKMKVKTKNKSVVRSKVVGGFVKSKKMLSKKKEKNQLLCCILKIKGCTGGLSL